VGKRQDCIVPLNLLFSYAGTSQKSLHEFAKVMPEDTRVIMDSGAFTAFRTGKEIKLDKYVRFINDMPFAPYAYINLDVIGNPIASFENYLKMRNLGCNPVPVITKGASVDEFDEYTDAPFVALGGLVGGSISSQRERVGWIDKCMRVATKKNIPVHLLGISKAQMLMRWPVASGDSSSWDAVMWKRVFNLYAGGGRIIVFDRKKFMKKLLRHNGLEMLTRQHGVEPHNLTSEENWSGRAQGIRSLSGRAYIKYANDLESQTGKKLFLAASVDVTDLLIQEYKNELEGKYVSNSFVVGRTR